MRTDLHYLIRVYRRGAQTGLQRLKTNCQIQAEIACIGVANIGVDAAIRMIAIAPSWNRSGLLHESRLLHVVYLSTSERRYIHNKRNLGIIATMADDHDHGHDVHFESADAGASLTYPQQAGTVRKNAFLVIKGRPCKVSWIWTLDSTQCW